MKSYMCCKKFTLLTANEKLVDMEKSEVFLKALECYSTSKLDFVDALLWAYHAIEQQEVFTFDDKLNKYIQRTG